MSPNESSPTNTRHNEIKSSPYLHEREELAILLDGKLHLLGHGAHSLDALSEGHVDLVGAAAQGRRGAVKGRVTGPEHDNGARQFGQLVLAAAAAAAVATAATLALELVARLGPCRDAREEVLRGPEPVLGREALKAGVAHGVRQAEAEQHGLETVGLEAVHGEVAAEGLPGAHFDAQVLHELDLPVHGRVRESVARNFRRGEPADNLVTLEDGDVAVADAREDGGGRDAGRAAPDHRDGSLERLRELVQRRGGRVADLRDVHLHEHLHRELLQPANVDGAALRGCHVAAPGAQVGRGAHHAAREPQRVVRQDLLGRSVVVLVADGRDERLDVDLRGAAALARRVHAAQAALRLLDSRRLRQRRVLGVVKVVRDGRDHADVALPVPARLLRLGSRHQLRGFHRADSRVQVQTLVDRLRLERGAGCGVVGEVATRTLREKARRERPRLMGEHCGVVV